MAVWRHAAPGLPPSHSTTVTESRMVSATSSITRAMPRFRSQNDITNVSIARVTGIMDHRAAAALRSTVSSASHDRWPLGRFN